MTRTEHLLAIVGEEGAEVTHRAMKAMRFTLADVDGEAMNPGRLTAAERLAGEVADLIGVYEMLADAGLVAPVAALAERVKTKKARVESFLRYSAEVGTLDPATAPPPAFNGVTPRTSDVAGRTPCSERTPS